MPINVTDATIDVFVSDSNNSDNLTHQWPLNETKGSTGTDVQGSADLSVKGGVTISSARTFDGLSTYFFSGSDDSYAAIKSKNYNSSGTLSAITVAAWIRPNSTNNDKCIIGFDSSEYYRLVVDSNGKVVWTTTDSTGTTHNLTSSTAVDDDSWHFVAGTFDVSNPKQKRLHIDGSEDASKATAHGENNIGTGTTRYGFVGDDSEASSEDGSVNDIEYQGDMATVFIYEDRALTTTELSDIHSAGQVAVPPDFTIPSSDITSLDVSQRIDKRRDTGRIVIENNDGIYNVGSNEINSGDLLRFRTQLQGESSLTHQWSAMAETILYEQVDYNKTDIRIEASDFVFGIISNRIAENNFEGVSISTIVNNVMNNNASEVFTDRVQTMSETDDAFLRGDNLLDFMNEMAGKANAIVSNRDRSLVFEKAREAEFAFSLSASDKGPHIIRKEGSNIANRVRVDGGLSQAIDDQQTTQSSTTTVTESSRLTHQLSTRKATIDRIDLYTDPTQNQIDRGEDLRIRIQKDDGGSPVAVGDEESDITSEALSPTDTQFVDGGLSTFIFPDHVLPEPNPWMIIESTGSGGIDVGVDGSNNPRYDAYFQFRLSTISGDKGSQDSYRQRDARIFNGSLRTREAAKQVGNSKVRHNKFPDEFIEFNAESARAHNLHTGEVITVNETNATNGDFIVTDLTTQYQALKLSTQVEAQLVDTV